MSWPILGGVVLVMTGTYLVILIVLKNIQD